MSFTTKQEPDLDITSTGSNAFHFSNYSSMSLSHHPQCLQQPQLSFTSNQQQQHQLAATATTHLYHTSDAMSPLSSLTSLAPLAIDTQAGVAYSSNQQENSLSLAQSSAEDDPLENLDLFSHLNVNLSAQDFQASFLNVDFAYPASSLDLCQPASPSHNAACHNSNSTNSFKHSFGQCIPLPAALGATNSTSSSSSCAPSPSPSCSSSLYSPSLSTASSPVSPYFDEGVIPVVACASCKKSHIKCDHGRPCQNCQKHPSKAATCRDADPKPRGRPKGGSKAAAEALLLARQQQLNHHYHQQHHHQQQQQEQQQHEQQQQQHLFTHSPGMPSSTSTSPMASSHHLMLSRIGQGQGQSNGHGQCSTATGGRRASYSVARSTVPGWHPYAIPEATAEHETGSPSSRFAARSLSSSSLPANRQRRAESNSGSSAELLPEDAFQALAMLHQRLPPVGTACTGTSAAISPGEHRHFMQFQMPVVVQHMEDRHDAPMARSLSDGHHNRTQQRYSGGPSYAPAACPFSVGTTSNLSPTPMMQEQNKQRNNAATPAMATLLRHQQEQQLELQLRHHSQQQQLQQEEFRRRQEYLRTSLQHRQSPFSDTSS